MKKSIAVALAAIVLVGAGCSSQGSNNGEAESGEATTQSEVPEAFTAYCAMQEEECATYLDKFTEETGIEARFVRLGAGEILARVDAEKGNPQASVWLGGAADNQVNAAGRGLIEQYAPEAVEQVDAKFRDQDGFWIPLSWAPQLIVQNPEVAASVGAPDPTTWEALADPAYKNLIALADPASSGTAFVFVAGLIQAYGEDEAFELLKAIDQNVVQYTASGAAPVTMTGQGETAAAVTYLQDAEVALGKGFPVKVFFPASGVPYEIAATALIANAPEKEIPGAKAFIDWTLTESGQQAMAATGRLSVLDGVVNPDAQVDVSDVKLIDYDLVWAGENRDRILARY